MAASNPLPDPKWKNARSFPRFATDLPVQVEVLGGGETLAGRLLDIGLGGACVLLEASGLPARQKVVLEFRFPMSSAPLRLRATLRHRHREDHYGFQFVEVRGEERETIRRACAGLRIV
ncbi:MAG: PilZ domain-containing protein [Acidobacteriota bacterium]|nr:PilZ domain-containing protein [Acidobacteriota bacterium]